MDAVILQGSVPEFFNGYGSGDGYGYWIKVVASVVKRWPDRLRERFNELTDSGAFLAFWKSAKDGSPANGGKAAESAQPGLVQKIKGPLKLCGPRALHATLKPEQWKGERLWVVALFGELKFADDDKVGALEREIIGEITSQNPVHERKGLPENVESKEHNS